MILLLWSCNPSVTELLQQGAPGWLSWSQGRAVKPHLGCRDYLENF